MSSPIENLPTEMLERISFYLKSKQDKSSFRLVSGRFAAAGSSIFHDLRLSPDVSKKLDMTIRMFPSSYGQDPKGDSYQHILAEPFLAKKVRRVHIDTSSVKCGLPHPDYIVFKMCSHAMQFPNLRCASLRFRTLSRERARTPEYNQDDEMALRDVLLGHLLFLWEFSKNIIIRELVLENFISNCGYGLPRDLPQFLEQLRALTVVSNVIALSSKAHARHWHNLINRWVAPASQNLTRLVLYSDQYFGFADAFRLRDLRFPHIKTLALGRYVFFSDEQVEWLVSLKDTLQNLYLDDCPIVYLGAVRDIHDHIYANDVVQHRDLFFSYAGQGFMVCSYHRRWHHYFRRLRGGLNNLRTFRFGVSKTDVGRFPDVHPSEVVDDELRTSIFENRYRYYDGTVHWEGIQAGLDLFRGAPGAGEEYQDTLPFPRCDMEDGLALNELLVSIGSPPVSDFLWKEKIAKDLETALRLRPYSTKIALRKGPTFRAVD